MLFLHYLYSIALFSSTWCWFGFAASEEISAQNDTNLLTTNFKEEQPTVLIALLVRNKAGVLPLFLSYFEQQTYDKKRISLWIRADHNIDNSVEILQLWLNHTRELYHSVNFLHDDDEQGYPNESSPLYWTNDRYHHLISLKEEALAYARSIWADYIFYLDVDALLTYPQTLVYLTSLRLPIVAPMLISDGLYSNFWCGMTNEYYYQRMAEYREIYGLDKKGIFKVPMVHSAVLVNLRYIINRSLTFDREKLIKNLEEVPSEERRCRVYDGPEDDIIIFAVSANCSGIPAFVSNEFQFGSIFEPLEPTDSFERDAQQLVNARVHMVEQDAIIPMKDYFLKYVQYPEKDTMSLDHIYMINLKRRPLRRQKMENLFLELGLDVEYFEAVDGNDLTPQILRDLGIKPLPAYRDPMSDRLMTMGEIGCFLSHYRIWEKMVKKGQKEVLVLEDDIHFEPFFKERVELVLNEARNVVEYDLIYFGRKRLQKEEPFVENAEHLVHARYSYWTLGYVLSLQGARKLLAAKPLEKLVPVDEFLPIMFNRHPNDTWNAAYPERNLIAFSSAPLLIFPIHYSGETGYISDTENSTVTGSTEDEIINKSQTQLNDNLSLDENPKLFTNTLNVGKAHEEF